MINNKSRFKEKEIDIACYIDFLKTLLSIDPSKRFSAKIALKHPFITKEHFEGYFNYYTGDSSYFMGTSMEASMMSEASKMFNSLAMPYNIGSNTSSIGSFQKENNINSSICSEHKVFRPNLQKIPVGILRKFPYANIMNYENYRKPPINKEYANPNMNYTFSKLSNESSNKSYGDEFTPWKKKRALKLPKSKKINKYDQCCLNSSSISKKNNKSNISSQYKCWELSTNFT